MPSLVLWSPFLFYKKIFREKHPDLSAFTPIQTKFERKVNRKSIIPFFFGKYFCPLDDAILNLKNQKHCSVLHTFFSSCLKLFHSTQDSLIKTSTTTAAKNCKQINKQLTPTIRISNTGT